MGDEATVESVTATMVKKAKKNKLAVKVDENDLIMFTANEIENLTQEASFDLARQLIEDGGLSDFKLGGVLSVIQEHSWFGQHSTFKDLLDAEFSIQYRKAMYLIEIYRALVDATVPWEKVKDVGWSKLKEIAKILNNKNVDGWVTKAKAMTVLQLQDAVEAYLAKKEGAQSEEGDTITSTVTTLTFKVHADQKETIRQALDKAKAEVNSEFDTVALESICVGYLGGTIQAAATTQPTLKEAMSKHSYEEVLEVFEQCFPDLELTVAA